MNQNEQFWRHLELNDVSKSAILGQSLPSFLATLSQFAKSVILDEMLFRNCNLNWNLKFCFIFQAKKNQNEPFWRDQWGISKPATLDQLLFLHFQWFCQNLIAQDISKSLILEQIWAWMPVLIHFNYFLFKTKILTIQTVFHLRPLRQI